MAPQISSLSPTLARTHSVFHPAGLTRNGNYSLSPCTFLNLSLSSSFSFSLSSPACHDGCTLERRFGSADLRSHFWLSPSLIGCASAQRKSLALGIESSEDPFPLQQRQGFHAKPFHPNWAARLSDRRTMPSHGLQVGQNYWSISMDSTCRHMDDFEERGGCNALSPAEAPTPDGNPRGGP
jgi:hypothetical protein